MRLQIMDEASDDLVGISDGTVVIRAAGQVLRGRVRLMRLGQMQEQKSPRRAHCVEPMFGNQFRFASVPLEIAQGTLPLKRRNGESLFASRHIGIEKIE